ncbi:response regulator transcription factor [Myxococcota bacterium]
MTTTLLAVDDSKTMRKVLQITFAGEDYRTVLAESSADALAKLRSDNPAVALVDANLAEESGYDLCQKLKREAPSVGVIILSSKQQPYDRGRGSSAGADDFMDKPFDTQQLLDKVRALVRKGMEAATAGVRPVAPAAAARGPAPVSPGARPFPTAAGPSPVSKPSAASASSLGRPAASGGGAQAAPARPGMPVRSVGSSPLASGQPPAGRGHSPAQAAMPTSSVGASRPQPHQVASPANPSLQARPGPAAHAPAPQPATPAVAAAAPPAPAAGSAVSPVAVAPLSVDTAVSLPTGLDVKLHALGLTKEQVAGVLALSKEVVEQVVWEVVPTLAEVMIREEIRRLTSD